jgi:hypothetical protein
VSFVIFVIVTSERAFCYTVRFFEITQNIRTALQESLCWCPPLQDLAELQLTDLFRSFWPTVLALDVDFLYTVHSALLPRIFSRGKTAGA